MPPLAGYVRVSHVGTRSGASFHSPDDQAAEIRAWAKARKRDVVMLAPELGGKGSDAQRPIFRAAIAGVKAGEYSGLVVAYLSRAGRDLRLMLDLWAEVEQAGGVVFFARENIDASTPSGRLQRNLLASIAQHELEERREGFERARGGAVAAGIWQRRQTPLGFRRDQSTRRLVPDRNAAKLRSAFLDRAAGATITDLADRLGMTPSGTRQLLGNRVYLGELRVGQHLNTTGHPPLVTLEEFEAAQRSVARPARSERGPALLAGLVRCAGCGHVMTRTSGKAEVYACSERHSGGRCPAPTKITCHILDDHVEQIALHELARLRVEARATGQVERVRVELAEAERELETYLTAVSAADIGAEAFGAGARSRSQRVARARDELRAQLAREPALPVASGGVEVWSTLDSGEKNTVLRGLLAAVVVRRAGGRGARVTLADRVRVIAAGTDLQLARRNGGRAAGIVPIELLHRDDKRVLGVPTGEHTP